MSILDMKFFSFIGFKKKPKSPWQKFYKKKENNIFIFFYYVIIFNRGW